MEKQQRIDEIKAMLTEIQDNRIDYIDESEIDDYIDITNKVIEIGNLRYTPSYVLKNVDPIAYRQYALDIADSFDVTDIDDWSALYSELQDLGGDLDD